MVNNANIHRIFYLLDENEVVLLHAIAFHSMFITTVNLPVSRGHCIKGSIILSSHFFGGPLNQNTVQMNMY